MIDKERKTSKSIIHLIDNHDSFVMIKIASHTNILLNNLLDRSDKNTNFLKSYLTKKHIV